jgi:hypothetical protein
MIPVRRGRHLVRFLGLQDSLLLEALMFRHAGMAMATLLLAVMTASAQSIHVTPFYGYMYPQGELPERFALHGTNGDSRDISGGEFESRTALYGATVAVAVWKWLAVEATLVSGQDKIIGERLPQTDVQLLAYSAGLELQLPSYNRFGPYLLAGVGVKSYDFDLPAVKAVKDREFNVGAGVNVTLLQNVALNLQARDFISEFSASLDGVENELQHDIFVAAGLTLRFHLGLEQTAVVARR